MSKYSALPSGPLLYMLYILYFFCDSFLVLSLISGFA
jgi:hypothetical protein